MLKYTALKPTCCSRLPLQMVFCVCASASRVRDDGPLPPVSGKTHDAYPPSTEVCHEHDITFPSRFASSTANPRGPPAPGRPHVNPEDDAL